MSSRFWALVLAGGRSSRMGQDKALISIGPETLLQRTCRIAAENSQPVAVITPYPERYRTQLPHRVELLQESSLPGQTNTDHGPLVGLLQGMKKLASKPVLGIEPDSEIWLLALACDLPNLSSTVLAQWHHYVEKQAQQVMVCVPHRQGRWEPLCGFYRITCQDSIQRYVDQGGRSFQGWLSHQHVTQLPLKDDTMLLNLNTPEDLQQWRAET